MGLAANSVSMWSGYASDRICEKWNSSKNVQLLTGSNVYSDLLWMVSGTLKCVSQTSVESVLLDYFLQIQRTVKSDYHWLLKDVAAEIFYFACCTDALLRCSMRTHLLKQRFCLVKVENSDSVDRSFTSSSPSQGLFFMVHLPAFISCK